VKLHSLELGYETKIKGLMPVSLRGYLRRESDVITERRVFLNDTTLLTTRENLGDRRAGGIEFSVMGMIPPNMRVKGHALPNIRFMFNGNWGFIEQDRTDALGLTGEKRSSPSLQLQGGGQWQINPDNVLTLMTFHQGKAAVRRRLPRTLRHDEPGLRTQVRQAPVAEPCAPTTCCVRPTRSSASRPTPARPHRHHRAPAPPVRGLALHLRRHHRQRCGAQCDGGGGRQPGQPGGARSDQAGAGDARKRSRRSRSRRSLSRLRAWGHGRAS
jgi:hypothetical protein